MKDEEIRQLKVQEEGPDWIWEVVGTLDDVLNKAHLFDNDVKAEGQLLAQKIITILVNFGCKMEATLVDIQKLVFELQARLSQPPLPLMTPQKEKQVKVLKTPLHQRPIKEVIAEVAKIEILPAATRAATLATVKTKKTEKDLETKTISSELSLHRKSAKKKTKEPSPESKEEEESTAEETGSSGEEQESEEEAKPMTLPAEKRRRMETQASDKKKPAFMFRTPVPLKQPVKTPRKGESSQKKAKSEVDRNMVEKQQKQNLGFLRTRINSRRLSRS